MGVRPVCVVRAYHPRADDTIIELLFVLACASPAARCVAVGERGVCVYRRASAWNSGKKQSR